MSRNYDPNARITKTCAGCGIQFQIVQSILKYRRVRNHYHNRECYRQNCVYSAGSGKASRYNKNYRCPKCQKYIPKEKAIMYTTTKGDKTYPICPDPGCVHTKLLDHPKNSRFKEKFRREQEQQQQQNKQKIITPKITI